MHQCTDLKMLDDLASQKTISAYIGFDCTAPSLHAGSLMQIMIYVFYNAPVINPLSSWGRDDKGW